MGLQRKHQVPKWQVEGAVGWFLFIYLFLLEGGNRGVGDRGATFDVAGQWIGYMGG
jgi:hypothetical protein